MFGFYKVESQHVFVYKVKIQRLYKVAWPRKNIKLDVGFWGYLWTCPMTIKWDAEHPDSNTCVEQWHYNVVFLLNNDRCSSDDFLNRDDGSIDMIVYKVEGPRSNFGGISSISSMGNPKDFEWLRNRAKPTAKQIYGKTKSMLDWPLYTPSANRECLYKVARIYVGLATLYPLPKQRMPL